MSNQESKINIFHKKWVVTTVIIVTVIFFLIAFIPGTGEWIENEYLITAAAIIPLLYTTIAQHIELGYQRKELKESTVALQGQQQELNETKEINDKHQINNQFFQLLTMRENFTHSTNSGSNDQRERLYNIIGIYSGISKSFLEIVIKDYIETLMNKEKLDLYQKFKKANIKYSSDSQRIEEVKKTVPRLVSYYDNGIDDFNFPESQKLAEVQTLKKFINDLCRYVDEDKNTEEYTKILKTLLLNEESKRKIISKHFAYHKSIVIFLSSIKYIELREQLKAMYLDILTEAERFYFGIKLMNKPLSTYIFTPPKNKEVKNKMYKESIVNIENNF